MHTALFCSYVEPEHVESLKRRFPTVRFEYHPSLLPKPRYTADHIGEPIKRSTEQDEQWRCLLQSSNILFDFDYFGLERFKQDAKQVEWIQASSAGVGQFVLKHRLHELPAVITTASGIHARPLAEFVLWSMLSFSRGYPTARKQQREHVWQRFCGEELAGKVLAIVGLGEIGQAAAQLASCLGVETIGSKRTVAGITPQDLGVAELYNKNDLSRMLSRADYVCLVSPHTPETEGMIGEAELSAMKPDAVLINIGRGALIQEAPLLRALQEGWIRGAVLDVAPLEPLPPEHPLWEMENVILFPHSASTSSKENERLINLFADNLEHFLSKEPLTNVFDASRLY
ncbi:MAG: D-2-hydroxyacid dehydrogenase [Deinococcota bacterium]|nr:D-2-hydroxyacid dehydrogenase [Deinococcota bacterium]